MLATLKILQLKIVNPITLALIFALFSCTNTDNHKAKDTSVTADEVTPEYKKIVKLIREKDSLLFQIGFNQIDTLQVVKLTSTDFEFYHDEHGILRLKVNLLLVLMELENCHLKLGEL